MTVYSGMGYWDIVPYAATLAIFFSLAMYVSAMGLRGMSAQHQNPPAPHERTYPELERARGVIRKLRPCWDMDADPIGVFVLAAAALAVGALFL